MSPAGIGPAGFRASDLEQPGPEAWGQLERVSEVAGDSDGRAAITSLEHPEVAPRDPGATGGLARPDASLQAVSAYRCGEVRWQSVSRRVGGSHVCGDYRDSLSPKRRDG
jgi:hypothetical protein